MKLSVLVPMYLQSFKYFINIKPFKFLTALWEKFPWERWNEELNPEIIEKHCEVRIQMQIFWTQNNEFSKQECFRGRYSGVWHVLFYFVLFFQSLMSFYANFQAVKKQTEECHYHWPDSSFQISVSYRNQVIGSHFPYSLQQTRLNTASKLIKPVKFHPCYRIINKICKASLCPSVSAIGKQK